MLNNEQIELYNGIWQRFMDGDEEALSSIYFEFYDVLFNFGMKYSSDRFLVEDCIQNLFVDLLRNRHKQKPVTNIKFYLLKSLRNQMASERRKTKKLLPVGEPGEAEFRISYSAESSLIAIETDELRSMFLKMVTEKLTIRQKEALYLKFNCGFDYVQIAVMMQISVESARTMIYRTLKSIKETFGLECYSDLILFSLFRSFFQKAN
ncbi:RNA polymerase sigma factor [Gaoshiqia sediminis]|uniref:Sigma-70 family RNA polymerase sigma factor n=1 Tax=Gaoshiqia sediminis TaxID=2986998 RepID=A0AA41YE28_9BACT|nr:sigma-70 family RNA polymerase sigma factor [Gaoshiqia sediminis]MCW0483927.1 sigma-70 family RNA polymerase sigma factor [Gaoshiqia sediminis]